MNQTLRHFAEALAWWRGSTCWPAVHPGLGGLAVNAVDLHAIRVTWGTTDPLHLRVLAPDLAGDELARMWWAQVERAASSPRRAVGKQQLAFQLDVREVLEVHDSVARREVAAARGAHGQVDRRWVAG